MNIGRKFTNWKGLINVSPEPKLMEAKIELIDSCFKDSKGISSFADLGGVWGVNGGYTWYILSKCNIKKAYLFDSYIPGIVVQKSKSYPQGRYPRASPWHFINQASLDALRAIAHSPTGKPVELCPSGDLELYQLDFGSDENISKIPNVDMILLYESLACKFALPPRPVNEDMNFLEI